MRNEKSKKNACALKSTYFAVCYPLGGVLENKKMGHFHAHFSHWGG